MKTNIKNLFLLPALIAALGLITTGRATAQSFTTLHSFTATSASFPATNSDGALPYTVLILSGNTLYGTTHVGGSGGGGTVFAVNADGTGFTTLHNFTGGSDGQFSAAGLVLSGSTLYGTAENGGSSFSGTVFRVITNGAGFAILHDFTGGSDGSGPVAGLILSDRILYGTAVGGGSSFGGTLFKVNDDGTGFMNLHNFTGGSDGREPYAGLILSGNILYGTTRAGGSSDNGTVFAVKPAGTGFTNLHSFTALNNSTNGDGANPRAGLILSGNTLYGTAAAGGGSGQGTVFALNADGTGFTNLHTFTALNNSTNSDGAQPYAELFLSGNTLYGTAQGGGLAGKGTVFALNTNGTGFTTLYSFTALNNSTNSDGANPRSGLLLSGNTLYGTAQGGGLAGKGTVFSLSLPRPQLTIIRSGANVFLTWTNAAFGLQTAPAITGTFTNLPGATSPYTNALTGAQQYFRLISN